MLEFSVPLNSAHRSSNFRLQLDLIDRLLSKRSGNVRDWQVETGETVLLFGMHLMRKSASQSNLLMFYLGLGKIHLKEYESLLLHKLANAGNEKTRQELSTNYNLLV